MIVDWLSTSGEAVLLVGLSALGIYAALVCFTRLAGVRSFSKMSSFDFAITIAFGSVLGSTILTKDPPLAQAVVGLACLFLLQYSVSIVRMRWPALAKLMDNDPILVMAGREILHENLRKARMTEGDLYSKLREANVCRLDQVRAVIAETTGDITVLHAEPDAPPLEMRLLEGVRDADRLRPTRAEE